MWTSYIITCVFTFITAAVIAEICSSLPLAGSIYLWAAEAGGPRWGRLFGFVVAWWSTTAWTTFCANFPSDSSSIKFRAVQWILTEILLALACIWNLLPRKTPNTNMYLYLLSNISSSILQVDLFRI
ncbi:hypothetical protein LB503_004808 [Fusarium chuoi]|nr:hypothetical protein LB503_004808 [Fusarium chuoi]